MAQQMVNGSTHNGSYTCTNRMSDRYAVVNPPFQGKHRKPQTDAYRNKRKLHWKLRNGNITVDEWLEEVKK